MLIEKEINYIFNILDCSIHKIKGHIVSHINANTGKIINDNPIFEDFGDIVPLFVLCKKNSFLTNEFKALNNSLKKDFYFSNKKFHSKNIIHTYDWSDLIYGLILFDLENKNKDENPHIKKYFNLIEKQIEKKKFISTVAIKFFKFTYFLPICTMNGCAMYPELLIFKEDSNNFKSNLMIAKKIIRLWTENSFFKKYNLFPDYLEYLGKKNLFDKLCIMIFKKQINKKNKSVTLFKQNTNAIASILSVYIVSKDKIYRDLIYNWYRSLKKYLQNENYLFINKWSKNEKGLWEASNAQLVDLLCDFHFYLKDEYFVFEAEKIANELIKKVDKFHMLPSTEKSDKAHCDQQVDFAVALIKLYKLTKNEKYLNNSIIIMSSIKKYFYKKYGIVEYVNIYDKTESTELCKIKFLILSLKGWLAIKYHDEIYKNKEFTRLLNDR